MTAFVTMILSACLVIWSVDRARHMSRATCHSIRIGVVLIGASALASTLSPMYDTAPTWLMPALMIGLVAYLWADRRHG